MRETRTKPIFDKTRAFLFTCNIYIKGPRFFFLLLFLYTSDIYYIPHTHTHKRKERLLWAERWAKRAKVPPRCVCVCVWVLARCSYNIIERRGPAPRDKKSPRPLALELNTCAKGESESDDEPRAVVMRVYSRVSKGIPVRRDLMPREIAAPDNFSLSLSGERGFFFYYYPNVSLAPCNSLRRSFFPIRKGGGGKKNNNKNKRR